MPSKATPSIPTMHLRRVLFVALLLLPLTPNLIYLWGTPPRSFWLGQLITGTLLLLAPLMFGAKPGNVMWMVLPFAVFTPVLAAYAYITGYVPSLLALQVLKEATREELANYIPAIIVCGAAMIGIVLAYWWVGRAWRKQAWPINPWIRVSALVLLTLVLAKDVIRQGVQEGSPILLSRLEKLSPTAPFVLFAHLELSGPIIPERADVLKHYAVTVDSATPDDAICVLVIGESARKRAFGLYNPGIDSTPLLAKRNLITFTNATAAGTATIQAVPILMTGSFPGPKEILPFKELGLIEAFRLAGFQTHWLSTQEADGEISSFITAFSVNADEKQFVNGRLERSAHRNPELKDDSALIPLLAAIATKPGRQFVVLHTLGSHLPYLRRYPPTFEKWPVAPELVETMWRWLPPYDQAQRTAIDHAYLNTVYYTDWILDQLISILETSGRSSSLIYLSDHGETDAKAPVMPANHGILTPDVTDIPFFMWLTADFRGRDANAIENLVNNTTKKISAQDVFSTLCDLYGIRTPSADPTRSLINQAYQEHPRFILSLDGKILPVPH